MHGSNNNRTVSCVLFYSTLFNTYDQKRDKYLLVFLLDNHPISLLCDLYFIQTTGYGNNKKKRFICSIKNKNHFFFYLANFYLYIIINQFYLFIYLCGSSYCTYTGILANNFIRSLQNRSTSTNNDDSFDVGLVSLIFIIILKYSSYQTCTSTIR